MKSEDKRFVENLVTLLGAKQAKEDLLKKVNNLSSSDNILSMTPSYGFIRAEYIKEYGEMLLYIERAYREQLNQQ
jgi:hypothetical protein